MGAPLFKKAILTLENGKQVILNAPDNTNDNRYICSLKMNVPVNYERGVKSVIHGITCRQNLKTPEQVWKVMLELAQDVGHQIRGYGLAATGVRVYIRESDINYGLAKQSRISFSTQSPLEIAQASRILFMENYLWNNPVRAVCISTFGLVPRDSMVQLNLFVDETRRMLRQKLDDSIDKIRGRFGKHSIICSFFSLRNTRKACPVDKGVPFPRCACLSMGFLILRLHEHPCVFVQSATQLSKGNGDIFHPRTQADD